MKLAPYVVGYLDLLGFSAEVLRVEEDPSHLMGCSGKFAVMKKLGAQLVERTVGSSVEMRWLSDTCVFARSIEILNTDHIERALREVSVAVGITQCRFACEDFFSRGGIAIGSRVTK